MLNNLPTATQLKNAELKFKNMSACFYKLALFMPEEMTYVWFQFHLKSSEWPAKN